eukprot:2432896-Prymnesium_polylepis.1
MAAASAFPSRRRGAYVGRMQTRPCRDPCPCVLVCLDAYYGVRGQRDGTQSQTVIGDVVHP